MKIVFYTGKGGVGKSTMAAATAWQISQDHRVLIVSLDPAHNLGDIFNVSLNSETKRLTDNLFARELDLPTLTRQYLQREVDSLSNVYKYLQTLNLDLHFSVLKYTPGLEEYTLLSSIEEIIRRETEYAYIVFDTPPTGLTLRFLALPRVTMTWIDRLIQIRRHILQKRYTIHKIRGEGAEHETRQETVLPHDESDDAVLLKLRTLEKNYLYLTEKLQGEACSIVVVFNPDVLAVRESERLITGLRELNLPLRLLIDNKISDDNREMAERVEGVLSRHAQGVPVQRVSLSKTLLEGDGSKLYRIPEPLTSLLS